MNNKRQKKSGKTISNRGKNKIKKTNELVISKRFNWYKIKCPSKLQITIKNLLRNINIDIYHDISLSVKITENNIYYKILSNLFTFVCVDMNNLTVSYCHPDPDYYALTGNWLNVKERTEKLFKKPNELDDLCKEYIYSIKDKLINEIEVNHYPTYDNFDYTRKRFLKDAPKKTAYEFLMCAKKVNFNKDVSQIIAKMIVFGGGGKGGGGKEDSIWINSLPKNLKYKTL
jgi:hypothetical protein